MAFWNEYASWADITYDTPWPGPSSGYTKEQWDTLYNGGGGGGRIKSQYDGLTDAQLSKAFKEGTVSEAQYRDELKARDKSDSAINELVRVNKTSITPPSLPGAGLADPSSGVKPSSPYDKLSDTKLQQYVEAGIMSRAELVDLKGQTNADAIMAQPLTSTDRAAIANLKKENPTASSSITGAQAAAGGAGTSSRSSGASGGGTGGSGSPAAAAPPAIAGDYVWNNGRPYIAYQGQKYMLPQGAQEDDPRVVAMLQRLGGGNTSGSVVGNTKNDLYLRGGTDLGKAVVLNGQQYRSPGIAPEQGADGKWYIPGQGTPFASEAAAKAAIPLLNVGAGLTSRLGNSPTAKAAAQGGYQQVIDPSKALFPTFNMDQSIAAGATKGTQAGDIVGTISNNTKNYYDITQGGISEGGGLTPVGNSMNPYDSFTGQMTNGDTIGMSSILGNSGVNTQYWLSQMSGLPPAEIAKLKIDTPEKALQFQQAIETLRSQGMMPNFASLYALNEPSGYQGAAGGTQLKWGSANGGASNTPYDQALAGFANYALGSPDITYLPDSMPQQNLGGTVQIGSTAYGPEAFGGGLMDYAKGGEFMLSEPSTLVGDYSGKPYARMAEAGKQEKVTIEPTSRDVSMGRDWMGMRPMRGGQPNGPMHTWGGQNGQRQMPTFSDLWGRIPSGLLPPEIMSRLNQYRPQLETAYNNVSQRLGQGGPTPFANGGEIYTGGKTGFQQQYSPNDQSLGYQPASPYDPSILNATFVPGPGPNSGQMVTTQQDTVSGQPNALRFADLGPSQMAQMDTRPYVGSSPYTGQIGATPVAYQTMQVGPGQSAQVPVYDVAGGRDYNALLGADNVKYETKWYNNGGQPVLVRVPVYGGSPLMNTKQIKSMDAQSLADAILKGADYRYNGNASQATRAVLQSGNQQAMLHALYGIDPEAAMNVSAQLAAQNAQNTTGQGDYTKTDADIQREAANQRYYGIDANNRARAGMNPATILNVPRHVWNGDGKPPWGNGPAPYQTYNGPVREGQVLPFDYKPGGLPSGLPVTPPTPTTPQGNGGTGLPPMTGWPGRPRRPRPAGLQYGAGLLAGAA